MAGLLPSPRRGGPLGYAGSAAEIQREMEVAMLVPSHPHAGAQPPMFVPTNGIVFSSHERDLSRAEQG